MSRTTPQIDYYLEMFRGGDIEQAFHGLLGIGRDSLPDLMERFRRECGTDLRETLIEVIWQYRDRSVIPFLGEVLYDSEPRIWRRALDGLVTLACPVALAVLRSARSREFSKQSDTEEFRHCLEEAIQQAEIECQKAL